MFGAYKKDAINIPHSLQVGALQPRDWGPVMILSFPEFSLSTLLMKLMLPVSEVGIKMTSLPTIKGWLGTSGGMGYPALPGV